MGIRRCAAPVPGRAGDEGAVDARCAALSRPLRRGSPALSAPPHGTLLQAAFNGGPLQECQRLFRVIQRAYRRHKETLRGVQPPAKATIRPRRSLQLDDAHDSAPSARLRPLLTSARRTSHPSPIHPPPAAATSVRDLTPTLSERRQLQLLRAATVVDGAAAQDRGPPEERPASPAGTAGVADHAGEAVPSPPGTGAPPPCVKPQSKEVGPNTFSWTRVDARSARDPRTGWLRPVEAQEMAAWSTARRRAWASLVEDPNAYYMRWLAPGEAIREGAWDAAELRRFCYLLTTHPVSGRKWGLFSMNLPGRTGEQCRCLFQKLRREGKLPSADAEEDTVPPPALDAYRPPTAPHRHARGSPRRGSGAKRARQGAAPRPRRPHAAEAQPLAQPAGNLAEVGGAATAPAGSASARPQSSPRADDKPAPPRQRKRNAPSAATVEEEEEEEEAGEAEDAAESAALHTAAVADAAPPRKARRGPSPTPAAPASDSARAAGGGSNDSDGGGQARDVARSAAPRATSGATAAAQPGKEGERSAGSATAAPAPGRHSTEHGHAERLEAEALDKAPPSHQGETAAASPAGARNMERSSSECGAAEAAPSAQERATADSRPSTAVATAAVESDPARTAGSGTATAVPGSAAAPDAAPRTGTAARAGSVEAPGPKPAPAATPARVGAARPRRATPPRRPARKPTLVPPRRVAAAAATPSKGKSRHASLRPQGSQGRRVRAAKRRPPAARQPREERAAQRARLGRLDVALAAAHRRAAHALGHGAGKAPSRVAAAARALGGPAYAPPCAETLPACGAATEIADRCRSAVARQRWERAWTSPAEGPAPQAARHRQQRDALTHSVTALLGQVQREHAALRQELVGHETPAAAGAARQAEEDELLLWGTLALLQ